MMSQNVRAGVEERDTEDEYKSEEGREKKKVKVGKDSGCAGSSLRRERCVRDEKLSVSPAV